jgi:hypothetical protein
MSEREITQVLHPPRFLFEDEGVRIENPETVQKTDNIVMLNSYAVCPDEGGVYMYTDGCKWPERAWPFREAVFAIDTVKRAIMNTAKFCLSIPRNIFSPSKIVRSAIEQFTDYTDIVFTRWGVYWKPQYYCTSVREIWRVGMEMAGDDIVSQRLVKAICMILEFDSAYRYRFQDLMGEFSWSNYMKNPAKELVRVMTIGQSRDPNGTGPKYETIIRLIPWVMRITCIRNGLEYFFGYVDLEKLKLDEIDWYRVLVWGDYNFRGLTLNDRLEERARIDLEWFMSLRENKT